MKNLRITKIITALIITIWMPSSFASPSSVETSPSTEGAKTLRIMGVDRRNEIKSYFITGSNGQHLIILKYCQDDSCRPLGLQGGYSLEMLEEFSEHWEKLRSDEQFKEFSEAWQKHYSRSVRNQVTDFFQTTTEEVRKAIEIPPSIEDARATLTITGVDSRNQMKSYFITGSNGQNLVILRYCQGGSCRPLGLQGGYSLEMLESSEHWEKLRSDEQFREFLEIWPKDHSRNARNYTMDFFRRTTEEVRKKAEEAAE